MTKLLLHTCCAPCSVYVYDKLISGGYEPILYFYNPNIHPRQEYDKRLNELIKFAKIKSIKLIIEEPDFQNWHIQTKGLEKEPEKGKRCAICFQLRLKQTAIKAKEISIQNFCTALTISPHKNSTLINKIGNIIAKEMNLLFLEENFKKNDGFKKSIELSKKYNMFRQNYCGCCYSQ